MKRAGNDLLFGAAARACGAAKQTGQRREPPYGASTAVVHILSAGARSSNVFDVVEQGIMPTLA